jgi:DNA primase
MAFPDRFLEELTDRTDIVELVNGYTALTKRGARHVGLCPFHNEKTPSFTVSQERNLFYCFGCGAGGGTIQFAMRAENLDFPNAVRFLAERAGLRVPEDDARDGGVRRDAVYALNREAALFYVEQLHSPQGESALRYLLGRGFTKGFIKRFGIGAAPDAWDGLLNHLTGKGHDKLLLSQAGLIKASSNGRFHDLFRARVVFPILDLRKNVIGFTARVLDDSLPKYINSPDSAAYSKNRHLFGLHAAKDAQTETLLLAEGCMDVLALHQHGFTNAVASLGTSLTEQQSKLMSRYAQEAVLLYDSDAAGQKAAERASGLLTAAGLKVRVVRLSGAKDPDEYLKRYGRDAFELLLRQAENHMDYKLRTLAANYSLQEPAGRAEFAKAASGLLADVPSPAEREVYTGIAAELCGVTREALSAEVRRARKRRDSANKARETRELRPSAVVQPKPRALRYADPGQAVAEAQALRTMLCDPSLWEPGLEGLFVTPLYARLYAHMGEREGQSLNLSSLDGAFTPEEIGQVAALMGSEIRPTREALLEALKILREHSALRAAEGADRLALRIEQKKMGDHDGKRG